jgi:hypothetical protein
MKSFAAGLATGLALASVTAAVAATLEGDKGYLRGWDVTWGDGKTICSEPFVWPITHQIQCDSVRSPPKPPNG